MHLLRSDGEPVAVAVDQVRDADEAGDELGRRPLVDLDRRADLLDLSGVHDREPVAHGERLLLVVGHVDEGDPDLLLDPLELGLHLLAQLQVERPERLVEQEHLRFVDDGPRERDALALAARQLKRLALPEAREPDHVERPLCRRRRSAFGTLRIFSPYSTFSMTLRCGNSA